MYDVTHQKSFGSCLTYFIEVSRHIYYIFDSIMFFFCQWLYNILFLRLIFLILCFLFFLFYTLFPTRFNGMPSLYQFILLFLVYLFTGLFKLTCLFTFPSLLKDFLKDSILGLPYFNLCPFPGLFPYYVIFSYSVKAPTYKSAYFIEINNSQLHKSPVLNYLYHVLTPFIK